MSMICVEIDALTPCLIDSTTGEKVDTEVIKVTKLTEVKKFNEDTGWYVNWSHLVSKYEVYALKVKGKKELQELIALEREYDNLAVHIRWAVSNPKSNGFLVKENKEF